MAARVIVVQLLLSASVASASGDDFSNNLFSDLAPLLALFGERVTVQYLSQSLGILDDIIFAMAPLGVSFQLRMRNPGSIAISFSG